MANSKSSKAVKPKPVTSKYCKEGGSSIHNSGLFATREIPRDTEIIQYVGEVISKEEADRRGQALLEKSAGTTDASVYIFILDDKHDIDGNVPHNTARLINHSCEPNCEAQIIDDEIWIVALENIAKGEELTFDYGFDLEHYEDHPCCCGKPSCIGYIVAKEHWPALRKALKAAKKKAQAKPKPKKKALAKKAAPASAKKKSPTKKKAAAKKAKDLSKKKAKAARKKSTTPAKKKAKAAQKKSSAPAKKKAKKAPRRSK